MRRKGALHFVFTKSGPQTDEPTPAPRRFPILTRSPSRMVCIWCLKTRTERDAAADCPALRIREIGPSNRRAHAGASKIPTFDMLIVEKGMFGA